MSILVTPQTRLLVQGITGAFGARHAQLSIDYGTQVVAGVTPGKGGQIFEHRGVKVPIFDTVAEAVRETKATASAVFVPPPFAADAILEGVDAQLDLVVAITEGIPVNDMIKVKRAMQGRSTRLIGPNCPGIVTPGEGKDSHGGCRIGIAPGYIHKRGHIGVVSRSGTLTYEAVYQLTSRGVGQSTCVGIGGDPVNGTSHLDVIQLFMADPDTHGIIMIGEIGGSAEEEAAEWIKTHGTKPVAGFIAGATAPPGRRMGHAGAIVSGGKGTAEAKIAAFKAAGIGIAATPSDMADTLLKMMKLGASQGPKARDPGHPIGWSSLARGDVHHRIASQASRTADPRKNTAWIRKTFFRSTLPGHSHPQRSQDVPGPWRSSIFSSTSSCSCSACRSWGSGRGHRPIGLGHCWAT